MKVLVCGGRDFGDEAMIEHYLRRIVLRYGKVEIVHGAALGADRVAGLVAKRMGLKVHEHPARWDVLGLGGWVCPPTSSPAIQPQKDTSDDLCARERREADSLHPENFTFSSKDERSTDRD